MDFCTTTVVAACLYGVRSIKKIRSFNRYPPSLVRSFVQLACQVRSAAHVCRCCKNCYTMKRIGRKFKVTPGQSRQGNAMQHTGRRQKVRFIDKAERSSSFSPLHWRPNSGNGTDQQWSHYQASSIESAQRSLSINLTAKIMRPLSYIFRRHHRGRQKDDASNRIYCWYCYVLPFFCLSLLVRAGANPIVAKMTIICWCRHVWSY